MKKFGPWLAIASLLLWPLAAFCDAPKVDPEKYPSAKVGEWLPVKAIAAKGKTLVIDYDGAQVALVPDIKGDLYAIPKVATGTVEIRFWHAGDSIKLPATGPLPPLPVATLTISLGAPPPDRPDPKDPPAPPTTGYYFLIIRPDGAASPEFTRIARDPAWKALRDKGHRVKDIGVSEVDRLGVPLPSGTSLPCVVTLQEGADSSRVARGPIPLPSDPQAILDLPKGVGP